MNKKIRETLKYLLRSKTIISPQLKRVDKLYRMSSEEMYAYKEATFLRIFHLAYNKSQFYHSLYTQQGIKEDDIKSLGDIKKLPIITKDMIKEDPSSLLTVPKWETVKNHTSGTTGSPLVVYEPWPALWTEQAYIVSYRRRCGFETGNDVLASLRGHLDRKDMKMYVGISKTLYLSSFQLNSFNITKYYESLSRHQPKAIEGYPSSILICAYSFGKRGLVAKYLSFLLPQSL